ncbi:glycosyltransferase family 4 protein [Qipengyuania nanhaisediminis]|uniref:Glycosyltransferase involved in cell wall bisynthesis n=1 Tax=Qipengyuania nanhaisediminis TaxID=604088 RepID=A0A1I5PFD7_9SPHN|nr:glycosyltransferase family 1 protein [Qipengyuania nanhaisediminis]SFP32832.1 Glycosyltransferase involved in cell wall bisynthesis [Qipengyuania nanhaisediminis]
MDVTDLRIALFSGNYNYTRDGANQALNRLADYLLRQGAKLRVYSPVVDNPDFEATGDLVNVPNVRMPVKGRGEYRLPLRLGSKVESDLERFAPNVMHLSSPDPSAHKALKWARARDIPVLASVHTRFETYPRYYGLGFLEPVVEAGLRRFYNRCDALVAPSESQIAELKAQEMHEDISIWSRGVDREIFDPSSRDMEWRRANGLADDDVAIVFLGRLVMEKGLDVFADTIVELRRMQVPHKVLVIGDGPARGWFEKALPGGTFVGFQTGKDLGRALASGDIFFNPSITETFGNVTLEAMACGLPVVAAGATGAASLVTPGETGQLVPPSKTDAFSKGCAEALAPYCTDDALRLAHGANGEKAARAYSWDAINQAVVDTYLRLHASRTAA